MNSGFGKIIRVIAIILMGVTAALNLLGGVGTTCAAFLTKNFPSMANLMDFRWLYQILVVLTIALGLGNIWSTISLSRGKRDSYRTALVLLFAGTILGAIHMAASLALRGKAVPANMKLYANVLTLIVFLILGLPGIREKVSFSKNGSPASGAAAGGLAAILAGIITLTTWVWVSPSHTYQGENWVNVLYVPLLISGSAAILGGSFSLVKVIRKGQHQEVTRTGVELDPDPRSM